MAHPAITSISPASGPTSGGTAVTIHGTAFAGATAVLFGSAPATAISVQSATVIVAISPAGSGTVSISVTTPAGSSPLSAGAQFAFTAAAAPAGTAVPFVDPGLSAQLVSNLLSVLTSATSPDAVEAQDIIMRRIALEGDVVGSRIPPLLDDITKFGGMINLLTSLGEKAMREQALAGILGVAGPSQPLGWISNNQPLAMADVTNDRPAGPAQPTIPLAVLVRSDYVTAVKAAMAAVHRFGATVPFASPPVLQLPLAPRARRRRTTSCRTSAANSAWRPPPRSPTRPPTRWRSSGRPGHADPWQVAARVLTATPVTVPPADYDAIKCTPTASSTVTLTAAALVPLGPILASAGFYPAAPLPLPANAAQTGWATLTNVTGLTAGVTRLGDELSLLYNAQTIAGSVFAPVVDWVWNGTAFSGS